MSKVNVELTTDYQGIDCWKISKARGKINQTEIYEALEKKFPGAMFIQLHGISEEVPEELYEEGDEVILYEPYDIIGAIIQYIGGADVLKQSDIEAIKKSLGVM